MKKTSTSSFRTTLLRYLVPICVSALITQALCTYALEIPFSIALFTVCYLGVSFVQLIKNQLSSPRRLISKSTGNIHSYTTYNPPLRSTLNQEFLKIGSNLPSTMHSYLNSDHDRNKRDLGVHQENRIRSQGNTNNPLWNMTRTESSDPLTTVPRPLTSLRSTQSPQISADSQAMSRLYLPRQEPIAPARQSSLLHPDHFAPSRSRFNPFIFNSTSPITRPQTHKDLVDTIVKSHAEINEKLCDPDLNLTCPISLALIRDPVKADDGITYERESIKEWLEKNSTSPLTQARISKTLLSDIDYARKLKVAFNKETDSQITQHKSLLEDLTKNHPKIYEHLETNPNYDLICPITRALIKEPVLAEDGACYEKNDISQWLNNHRKKSPITRKVISNKFTTDFRYIKKLRDAYETLKENNVLNLR